MESRNYNSFDANFDLFEDPDFLKYLEEQYYNELNANIPIAFKVRICFPVKCTKAESDIRFFLSIFKRRTTFTRTERKKFFFNFQI